MSRNAPLPFTDFYYECVIEDLPGFLRQIGAWIDSDAVITEQHWGQIDLVQSAFHAMRDAIERRAQREAGTPARLKGEVPS